MRLFGATVVAVASLASAQSIIDGASFGHNERISDNQFAIPSWHVSGANGWVPQVLSDRVILTPPHPGDKKGALWTMSPVSNAQWRVDFEFRASGPDYASGNLQLWYAKDGAAQVQSNNVYTVGNFEGLVVVVDMNGSNGAGIRAFLNDGSTHFASHPHIDQLAFGHCDYNYRNLGRPSKITLQQDAEGFQVLVDDHGCFRSNSIQLPAHNFFGVTATSSETPDSFEIWKFVTTDTPQAPHPDSQQHQFSSHDEQRSGQEHQGNEEDSLSDSIDDALASSIRDQQAQFADLHNRVQLMQHSIENLFKEIRRHSQRVTERMEQLTNPLAKDHQMQVMEQRIASLENKVQQLKADQKDWTGHFNDIQKSLKVRHDALIESFPESIGGVIASRAPNMGLFLFLLIAFQLTLAAAYVGYKRRLNAGPKKYL